MAERIGWEAWENISVCIPNINLNGFTRAEACQAVADGTHQWALLGGGVLSVVPNHYVLGPFEHFLEVLEINGKRIFQAR